MQAIIQAGCHTGTKIKDLVAGSSKPQPPIK
jgi:hypothetical protein